MVLEVVAEVMELVAEVAQQDRRRATTVEVNMRGDT